MKTGLPDLRDTAARALSADYRDAVDGQKEMRTVLRDGVDDAALDGAEGMRWIREARALVDEFASTAEAVDPLSVAASRRVAEIERVRDRLASDVAGALSVASRAVSPGRMSADSFRTYTARTNQANRLLELDERLSSLQAGFEAHRIEGGRDVDPYGKGSPHSFFADSEAVADASGMLARAVNVKDAEERLQRHGRRVAAEIHRRTEYGQLAERMCVDCYRGDDPGNRERVARFRSELRSGITTGGGATASASGGGVAAFVWPAFLLESWTIYRASVGAFADLCDRSIPMPDYGMEAYIPTVTGGVDVEIVSEGNTIAETDPTFGFRSIPIVELSGQITMSQAVWDRVGPGISADVVLIGQLKEQLRDRVDVYALAQVMAGAGTVTNAAGTFSLSTASGAGGFLLDVKKGKKVLSDTAGTRLRASHMFANSDFVDYLAALADAEGRPIFSPSPSSGMSSDLVAEGFSGFTVAGLSAWADDNIPLASSESQILVTRPDQIVQLEGPVVPKLFNQFGASTATPIISVKQYVATAPRFESGTAIISGSAYTASQFS